MGGAGSGRPRGFAKGSRWVVENGKRRLIPPSADPSPSTSTSGSFSATRSTSPGVESPSQEGSPPSLPPPRRTQKSPRLQPESPPLFGSTYRKVPEDDAEREDAFKAYRFYSRSLTGAWSKLLDLLSDEPADAEERAAANDAICLMMYQLDLTMLDWRVSVPLALGAPLISRAPAIQKKWGKKKLGVATLAKDAVASTSNVTQFPQAARGPEESA